MEWASIVWQVGLGLMLFALSILFLYLCAVLNSIRKNLSSIERLTSQEVGTLLKDIDQMVKVLNSELPQLLKNINEIAVSLDEISKSELQPITHNIQEVTGVVNQ